MTNNIYRDLQLQLDQYSVGFPATESGIELKILEHLFSVADATLFLQLTHQLESTQAIMQRIDQPVEQTAARLDDMAERGLLFRLKNGTESKYAAIPFVHGIFEFQVKTIDEKLARMMEQYNTEAFDKVFYNSGGMFLRTIPIQASLDATHKVAAYDDAVEILKSKGKIVVTDCVCRKRTELTKEGCGKELEACFMFGSMGQYYLDRNMGRQVDLKEALSIMQKAHEDGLVTQPATSQNPGGMCNCCGDCCGVLASLRQHPAPAQLVYTNHFAAVDSGLCSGCEACLERCQMDAIKMDDDGLAAVDLKRCIGCGLCITTCPTEAMMLTPKTVEAHMTPPTTTSEQMTTMAQKRGII